MKPIKGKRSFLAPRDVLSMILGASVDTAENTRQTKKGWNHPSVIHGKHTWVITAAEWSFNYDCCAV